MARILSGKEVAEELDQHTKEKIELCASPPVIALISVGEDDSNLSYERGVRKKSEKLGIQVRKIALREEVSEEELIREIHALNKDESVNGILLFRPLSKKFNEKKILKEISEEKDVDCATEASLYGVFTDSASGFPPCTPQAVMELLKYYQIPVQGKHVVVIGRSLVVGKPLSMMLLRENATVTICHSKTENLKKISKSADIVVACIGRAEFLNEEYFSKGQTVIDVGVNYSPEKQKLVGDVAFEDASEIVEAITPVPKGVGSITTSVLLRHVAEAALK